MSRLTDLADQLERNSANYKLPDFLRKLDERYTLRKQPQAQTREQSYDADGNEINDSYFPHFAIPKTLRARIWKLTDAGKQVFGYDEKDNAGIWGEIFVLALEHIIRWRKHEIDEPEMQNAIRRLCSPLPKNEYLNKNKKQKGN